MKLLLLDNFDSFTYNLLHLIEQFDGIETDVIRNNAISTGMADNYDRIIVSPGPGLPDEAGVTKDIVCRYKNSKPILGVCLGLQAMAEVCGGGLVNLPKVYHGVAAETIILDKDEKLFEGIPSPFMTGRYHSWVVDRRSLPAEMKITAEDRDGNIMAMRHKNGLLRGVQFHPESILTDFGKQLMSNWLFHC